jgi:glutamate-1-semialdehyde 2,1-aminomutase
VQQRMPHVEMMRFVSSGTEATMSALRVARAATGRDMLLKFDGCYHGHADSFLVRAGSGVATLGLPNSPGVPDALAALTLTAPFNDVRGVEALLEVHGDRIAAIIVEPVVGNAGFIAPDPEFLPALRRLATQHGTLLIFDEVMTGFRVALGGAVERFGVTPDLTTLGKAMANGYPISAIGGRADLMDLFSSIPGHPAFFAGTFNGHPAMSAAALATVQKLEREPVHEHVSRLGQRVRDGLTEVYRRLGVPVVVCGFGSVFVTYFLDGPVESYEDLLRNDAELFVGYRRALLPHGIFELPLNLKRSHISYAHDDADVDALLEATEHAVESVLSRA